MAQTAIEAFSEFQSTVIDLDPVVAAAARTGARELMLRLEHLPEQEPSFPEVMGKAFIHGPFSRDTQPRPLESVGIMLPLVISEAKLVRDEFVYGIHANGPDCPLWPFKRDTSNYIDSIRLLDRIKKALAPVAADAKAYVDPALQQTVTFGVRGQIWVYDVQPVVPIVDDKGKVGSYLAPDGAGNWKRRNPVQDDEEARQANRRHNSNLLSVMRLLKFWNYRTHKPILENDYFERLVLNMFSAEEPILDIRESLKIFFERVSELLYQPCPDPDGLGPDLDASVDKSIKVAYGYAVVEASRYAADALVNEMYARPKQAIESWGKVFGKAFPTYDY